VDVKGAAEVRAVLGRSGFPYRYLPQYSLDLDPMEPAWAKVKSELRRVGARTVDALQETLVPRSGASRPGTPSAFSVIAGTSVPTDL